MHRASTNLRYYREVPAQTITSVSEPRGDGRRGSEWALALALDCERPFAPPLRISLARAASVEIGRGDARAFRRDGELLRLDLDDRRTSQLHLRLVRDAGGWVVEDAGSKNGTRVNGERVERSELADGDVIECGGTFLVLRRGIGPIRDLELAS